MGHRYGRSEIRKHLSKSMANIDNKQLFSKVRAARELLRERANEILQQYLAVVAEAQAAGEYEVAAKSLQWLIEHMPSDTEGTRVVDRSIDAKEAPQAQLPAGPAIQIGIQVGGTFRPKELPPQEAEVIDVESTEQ